MLAYASQGLASDKGSDTGRQAREYLTRCDTALDGLRRVPDGFVERLKLEPLAPYRRVHRGDRPRRPRRAGRDAAGPRAAGHQLADGRQPERVDPPARAAHRPLPDRRGPEGAPVGIGPSLTALRSGASVFAAELRPPRAELATAEGMDAWIDTYHAVQRLTRQGTYVFLTDSAVGAQEEDNLRHLVTNLGNDVPRERIVPFLTSKHSLEYCLSYAERAHQNGFPALVVLGGDKIDRGAALGRARLAAAGDAAARGQRADTRRMGEPARGSGAAGGLPERPELPRGVLSDAGREPPSRRTGRRVSSRLPSGAASSSPAYSVCSTTAAPTRGRWTR